nr:scavenger receptor class F member 1-like [Crassostrea gigas]
MADRTLYDKHIVLLLIVLLITFDINSKDVPKCDGDVNGCCVGYFWNFLADKCEECAPGFTGVNCSSPCYYPSYGRRCQTNCICRKELCDIATGCRTVTTDDQLTQKAIYWFHGV